MTSGSTNQFKALVAVEDPAMSDLVASHVRSLGFSTAEAAGGEAARELAQKLGPDLVILDETMPGMSGWELCKWLKDPRGGAEVDEPVVIMLAQASNLPDGVEPSGAPDAWLVKPFELAELDERVRKVSIRPPANLGFASGTNSLRLVWSPASAGREVTYEVRFKLFAAQQWSAWETTGATSHEIVGLDSATFYDVQVRPRAGELSGVAAHALCRTMSGASEPYDLEKTGRPTPAFSDVLSCAPTERGEIEVRVLSDPGAYTYDIMVSGSNGVPVTVQRTSTTTVLTGLQPNCTYTIRARTVMIVGGITYHGDVVGQETCTTGLFMSGAVTCVPRSKDSILVTWPPLPGGSSPVSYSVRHKPRADEQWGPWGTAGVQTLAVLSGLQPDTLYDIEVRASEGDRQSEPVSASCTTLSV